MSTKTKEGMGAAAEARPTVRIPIKNILVEKQHRRFFDEKKLKEMAGSMIKFNVLQPLLVRVRPGETIDGTTDLTKLQVRLVAGERRLRAAKLAGLEEVPAQIATWNDQEAAEAQALENIQRADLTPIEEAGAFDDLITAGGYTVESLAQRIDKSETYVYRAIALLGLPSKAMEAIEQGKITPAHGHQLLRTPKGVQEKLTAWLLSPQHKGSAPTVAQLKEHIEREVGVDLTKAPFPQDVEYAGKVACAGCPLNSGNQKDLLGHVEKGCCTGPACFTAKMEQHRKDEEQRLQKDYPGMTFLGKGEEHPLEQMYRVERVVDELKGHKKLVAAIKAHPEKFAFAVVKDRDWRGNKLVDTEEMGIFTKDKAFVLKVIGSNHPEAFRYGARDSSSAANRETPKERFVRKFIMGELLKAAGASAEKGLKRSHLEAIVGACQTGHYESQFPYEHYGVVDLYKPGALKKLTDKQLAGLAYMFSVNGYKQVEEKDIKAAGINVAKIKMEAKVAALKAWEEGKGKKPSGKAVDAGDKEEDEE